MKILFVKISLVFLVFVSCKNNNNDLNPANDIQSVQKETQNIREDNFDQCKNKDTLTFQNDTLTVKSEFIMRGDGVVTLDISDKLIIYNQDDSVFGEIAMIGGESSYNINLPQIIIARQFIPMFDQFVFDVNEPNENDEYLEIYINKELKKIKKNIVSYQYESWGDYVKKSFINIRNCKNINEKIDKNTYEIINIRNDSMDIKSISKNSCDAVASYVDTKKTIRWKKNKELLIYFYECN